MQRNLVTSLVLYETIRTTKKRAEVISPLLDKLVTVSKTKTPHVAIRAINQVVNDRNASRKLMEVLKVRYAKRSSGFTRMTPLGMRIGDGAQLVNLELIDRDMAVKTLSEKAPKAPKKMKTSKKKEEPVALAAPSTASSAS
jgi:large subunit ribosomal protein L17